MLGLGLITGSLSVLPLLFGTFAYGPLFAPVFLATVVLSTLSCLAFALLGFVIAMRLFDLEKLKDLMLYLQVGFMALFVGGTQLLPQLMTSDTFQSLLEIRGWFLTALPPCWSGGAVCRSR